jgi:signal transduction histidine kinase
MDSLKRLATMVALWVICSMSLARAADPQVATRLDVASFVAGVDARPPEEGWQRVVLPDEWRKTHPDLNGFGWYRIGFTLPARPDQPLALYIPHLALIAEIRLNGSLLTPNVRFDAADGSMGTSMDLAPFYVALPSGLFRTGDNMLEIRLQGSMRVRSGLSEIWLGPPEALRASYLPRYLVQVVIPAIILVLLTAALSFLSIYAWRRRREYVIQLTVLAGVVLLLIYLSYMVLHLPIIRSTENALRVVITTLMFWGLCIGGYRLSATRIPGLMPALHVLSGACLLLTLGWAIRGDVGDRAWLLTWPLLPIRVTVAALLAYDGWRRGATIHIALGLTGLFWMGTLVQTDLMLAGLQPWNVLNLSLAGGLPFCVALLFYFAERFIFDREESLLAQRAAIVAERERILQDMHDGMGAQLITALRLARRDDVERSEVAHYIEESFLDLRLIIDSLDLTENDLLPLLGNLRFRLSPRLHSLGIELIWDVEPLPRLDYLTPESALAILRIVQEALNNAIQHARASKIHISVKPEAKGAAIEVADNGVGFHAGTSHLGARGVEGMRQRARKLGARLDIDSGKGGTRVRLWLP